VSGNADLYWKQVTGLSARGFRVISISPPPVSTIDDYVKSFDQFLDSMKISKVHIFGMQLGGYLAQCYAQYKPSRVVSLILCNSFCDTTYYSQSALSKVFQYMPAFMLRNVVFSNYPDGKMPSNVTASIDFVIDQVESLSHEELAGRLNLNHQPQYLNFGQDSSGKKTYPFPPGLITILRVCDEQGIPENLLNQLESAYTVSNEKNEDQGTGAKVALIKSGGNFPNLAVPDEVNLHLQVHLRLYTGWTPPEIEEEET